MKSLLLLFFCSICCKAISQERITVFQNSHVIISFSIITNKYAYLIFNYDGMNTGTTLVEYTLTKDELILKELQGVRIIDSLISHSEQSYQSDSIMLSSTLKVDDFAGPSFLSPYLAYKINGKPYNQSAKINFDDNLNFAYNEDYLHRALIPKPTESYNLEIDTGFGMVGPYTITTMNDVSITLLILTSISPDDFDYGNNLPKKIKLDGKKYKLKHDFVPWN